MNVLKTKENTSIKDSRCVPEVKKDFLLYGRDEIALWLDYMRKGKACLKTAEMILCDKGSEKYIDR